MRAHLLKAGLLLLGSVASLGASAQSPAPSALPTKPKLIVAIAIDQFSSDLFNGYRATYRFGLKRLAEGAVFPAGYQSHAATETCPGHSTILTGARPARSGIIANNWQNPSHPRTGRDGKPDYSVYCAEDPDVPGTNGSTYVVSLKHLRVPTLGDRMKARDPATKVVSVAGKDRAAVMLGGRSSDLSLWWENKGFTSYKGIDLTSFRALAGINAAAMAEIEKPTLPKLPAHCAAFSRKVATSPTTSVGTLAPRKSGDNRGFRASPAFDTATITLALAAMREKGLGKGSATDLLAIGLSGTDYVGHGFGTAGAEMCNQIATVDAQLGRLFAELDKSGIDYAVVLTADHGGHDLPERNREDGLPAAERVDTALLPQVMGMALSKQFGIEGSSLIGDGAFGDIYLSPRIPPEKRVAVRDAALNAYLKHSQVAAAFAKDELLTAPSPSGPPEEWSLKDRFKASFDPERSGDLLVALKPYVTPIPSTGLGYVATHGSPWGYDRRVPILFWWKGIKPFEQPNGIETVDILPSLAGLIDLAVPQGEIDGRCVDLAAGPTSTCPMAQ